MTTSSKAWNVRDHVPLDQFVIQSHRGAGELAEENTLPAFELAWELGTYPESDLRTTRDGVIVPFHDADFSRLVMDADLALQKKGVADLPYEELSKLDVGAWKGNAFTGRTVPKLSDVFEVLRGKPGCHLYVDVKQVDLQQLAREVRTCEVCRQVILATSNPDLIWEWKALVPESDTLLWMGSSEESLRQRIIALRETGFVGITQLQIHIYPNELAAAIAEPFKLSRAFISDLGDELRTYGILFQALPFTSDAAVYSSLLDLGVASFATDHPEKTLKAVRDYYNTPSAGHQRQSEVN